MFQTINGQQGDPDIVSIIAMPIMLCTPHFNGVKGVDDQPRATVLLYFIGLALYNDAIWLRGMQVPFFAFNQHTQKLF